MSSIINYGKSLIKKYSDLSVEMKASLWYTVCNIIQKGISLLTTPIFTRIMSTEQYGMYTVYQSWYSILVIFASLNLFYSAYMTGLTKYDNDTAVLTSSMQGLCTFITCIFFAVYICAYESWNMLLGLPLSIMLAMFVQMLLEPGFLFWSAFQRYNYKYKSVIIFTLSSAIISTLLGVVLVLNVKWKAEARIFSYVLVHGSLGLICYIINLSKGKNFFSKKYWRYSLKFGIPLIPHYLSYSILNQSDRVMIANLVGQAQAAIYSVAYTIAMMLQIVTNAINNAFTPYTYKCVKERKFAEIRETFNFLIIIVAILSALITLFGPEIVKIFASSSYYEAIWIIPPVSASAFFLFLYPLFSTIEFYYEKSKFIMIASSCGAVLNVILNGILIPKYGYLAAGYTTLFCYIIFSIAHYIFYKILLNKNLGKGEQLYDEKLILIVSILIILFMAVALVIYNFLFIRYALIFIICIVIFINRKRIIEMFGKAVARR